MRKAPKLEGTTALSVESVETIGGRRSRQSEELDEARDGPTRREAAALRRVQALSRLLDDAVRVPGTNFRVGLDPIVGVLPVGGDAITAAIALYPVAEAYRLGLPKLTLVRMLGRVGVDAVAGSIPVLGGLFDAVFKANSRNARTLERHLRDR